MNKKPTLTHLLIVLSVIVFLLELYYESIYGEKFLGELFYNYGFSFQNLLARKFWVFITSIFLHGGAEHLILNVIALFFFGRVVEIELGKGKFLLIFFASAFIGDLAILLATLIGLISASVPTIGISAAVFGLMGTAMLVKPFEFIFYPYLIPIPLILVALIYTLYNIAAFLLVTTTETISNVSYISHIGGLASGMFFGFKEEGSKKGFIVLLILLVLLIATPFIWIALKYLENFNYIAILTEMFK